MGRALVALVAVGLLVLGAAVARADEETIEIVAGGNVVTWNGAAPYSIASFADTPVTHIHRWDAVEQRWLSRVVGREDSTLPELHLLPRVQYLVVAEGGFDLVVPDPVAGVDPYAELRFSAAPEDPLRFEAYWPNEDSPLEDLVVLRGEDERLSVEAWVAGGSGEIEVYWVIDGRVNHRGVASEDVELRPGGHDHGMVFAVDKSGQVEAVRLPRVVKLPPLDISAIAGKFGIVAHFGFGHLYRSVAEVEAAAALIEEAGFDIVRKNVSTYLTESGRLVEYSAVSFDKTLDIVRRHDLQVLAIIGGVAPGWNSSRDTSRSPGWGGVSHHDSGPAQLHARLIARRWPQQLLFEIGNEPNLGIASGFIDPVAWAKHHKAVALGVWYENPDAIITSGGICCYGLGFITRYDPHNPNFGAGWVRSDGIAYLDEAYKAGMGRYTDIVGLHPMAYTDFDDFRGAELLEDFIDVVDQHGDQGKFLWANELSVMHAASAQDVRAHHLTREMEFLSEHPRVLAPIVYHFRDDPEAADDTTVSGLVEWRYDGGFTPKPIYWAIREYLTGQPPPE